MPSGVGSYGYPKEKQLRRRARKLAQSSVPTARSVRRPFDTGIGDVRGFTTALLGLLRSGPSAGAAYDDPIASQQQADSAAQARLGELGPEYAGAAVAAGSQGRSAMSKLLAGQAAAGGYSARQPGIGAARGALGVTGLANARSDALRERGEALRQAFPQAYQQVQSQALALSMANADLDYRDQQQAMDWFNAQTARMGASGGGGGGGEVDFDDLQQVKGALQDRADSLYERVTEKPNPNYDPRFPSSPTNSPTIERQSRPGWGQAMRRLRNAGAADLRQLGYSNREISRILRQILKAAGFKPPVPKGGPGVPKGGPGGTPGGGPPE